MGFWRYVGHPQISGVHEVRGGQVKLIKGLITVKSGFESVPLHQHFEFCATLQHWLAKQSQNKIKE